jgi:hypothetical protein
MRVNARKQERGDLPEFNRLTPGGTIVAKRCPELRLVID